jgi:hypothetical protein
MSFSLRTLRNVHNVRCYSEQHFVSLLQGQRPHVARGAFARSELHATNRSYMSFMKAHAPARTAPGDKCIQRNDVRPDCKVVGSHAALFITDAEKCPALMAQYAHACPSVQPNLLPLTISHTRRPTAARRS